MIALLRSYDIHPLELHYLFVGFRRITNSSYRCWARRTTTCHKLQRHTRKWQQYILRFKLISKVYLILTIHIYQWDLFPKCLVRIKLYIMIFCIYDFTNKTLINGFHRLHRPWRSDWTFGIFNLFFLPVPITIWSLFYSIM